MQLCLHGTWPRHGVHADKGRNQRHIACMCRGCQQSGLMCRQTVSRSCCGLCCSCCCCRHLRRSLLVNPQTHSITFTVRQPPKVLRKVPERPLMFGLGPDNGPEWEVAMDPTAADLTCLGSAGVVAGMPQAVSGGLAGAHGVLGRCTWFSVRLAAAAMDGEGEAERRA